MSSFGSLRPLEASGVGFVLVSRDVIAYSQRFAAVSQSSTVPSFDMTLLMDILGKGMFIELSPKSCLACLGVDSDGMRPWKEGTIAFGTSSPAKPARVVEYPGSRTRAEISSGYIESAHKQYEKCGHISTVTHLRHIR